MSRLVDNLFSDIPAAGAGEIVDMLVQTRTCRLERILSFGQATPPGQWYDQSQDEWVVLLQGRAGLRFEGEDVLELGPGDYIWIPAHCRHRVEWTYPNGPTVWLALHLTPIGSVEQR